jgi:integrase
MSMVLPARIPRVSGHILRVRRKRGFVWYVKYRGPDPNARDAQRQVQRRLGPEWPEAGPPPPGFFDEHTARAALEAILTDLRRGIIDAARTGVTFRQAAEDWMAWGELERGWRRSTIVDRQSCLRRHLVPAFGHLPLERMTTQLIERWKIQWLREHGRRRQGAKLIALLHSIFEVARRMHGLSRNPVADVSRIRLSYDAAGFDFYSPEEVWSIARAAASEQDAAIFVTAAFAGLRRGEIVALRWRDVDFERRSIRVETSVASRTVTATKGGRSRAVPMVSELAAVLARLGQRRSQLDREDPVFPGVAGDHLDGSALRRRFVLACQRAGVRVLRFHDLRHTFGSLAINRVSVVQLQAWMGHADSRTTMRYLHYRSQEGEAELLEGAFQAQPPDDVAHRR